MSIKLNPRSMQTIYEALKCLNTKQQTAICDSFIEAYSRASKLMTITDWFLRDVESLKEYSNVEQSFLDPQDAEKRKPIGPNSKGTNRIVYLLSGKNGSGIPVVDSSGNKVYRFVYHNREIAPLRTEAAGLPSSGAGGADFVGFRIEDNKRYPVVGEIKCSGDQNPFYAFVQLLACVSALATPNQIERADRYDLFGGKIGENPFDLVILLADFNDRGKKGALIERTEKLATCFKNSLSARKNNAGIGNILCLKMDSKAFEGTQEIGLHWQV